MSDVALVVADEDDLLLLSSVDSGVTWPVPEVVLAGVRPCCVSGGPDGAMFAGTRGNGLWSADGGLRSWRRCPTPTDVDNVRAIYGSESRLIIGAEPPALFEWHDGEWTPLGDLTTAPGAETWHSTRRDREGVHVHDIAVDPSDPGRVYAAIQVGGLAITSDGGATWVNQRNIDLDVRMIRVDPSRPGRLYAATGGEGLLASEDYGTTWVPIAAECGNYVTQFAIDPECPDRIYLGASRGSGPAWLDPAGGKHGDAGGRVFRSDDAGRTWQRLDGGLPSPMQSRIDCVALDPAAPERVFIGCSLPRGAIARDRGIYFSDDRGGSWRRILESCKPAALLCASPP